MGNGTWNIRMATVDDADAVARLLHDFNTEFDTASPGPEVLTTRLRRLLGSESTFAVLAERPAVAVALVTLRSNVWYEGKVALLDELYVVPRLRGRGIGSAVMDHALAMARATGVDAVEINVDEGDVDAHRFYVRHGFAATEPGSDERAFFLFRELTG